AAQKRRGLMFCLYGLSDRLDAVDGIAYLAVDLVLVSLTVLEIVDRDLREQSVRQDVLVLLDILLDLFAVACKFRLDEICGTAGDRLFVAKNFLDDLRIRSRGKSAVLSSQN